MCVFAALKKLERALITAERFGDPAIIQDGCVLAWNVSLPMLQVCGFAWVVLHSSFSCMPRNLFLDGMCLICVAHLHASVFLL